MGAATVLRSTQALQSDFWFTGELVPYRAFVEAYRDRRVDEAVAGVRAVEPEVIHALIDRVGGPDARPTGTDRDPALNEQLFRAAAMLHVDVADRLWSSGLERAASDQIEVALRWANISARDPEPVGSFRRRWFLGVAWLAFERGGWQDGVSFTDLAGEILPDDVRLLTVAAWLNEGLALSPVNPGEVESSGLSQIQRAKRSALLAAARKAGAALRVTPAATEAALRLARVRMLLGQGESVRELLTAVMHRTGVPLAHAYLARLLLGRWHLQTEEFHAAERLFREAIALLPEGQAARVALAQLLDTQGDRRAAAVVLEPILRADPGGGFIDPWVDYLLGAGTGPNVREALRREVRR